MRWTDLCLSLLFISSTTSFSMKSIAAVRSQIQTMSNSCNNYHKNGNMEVLNQLASCISKDKIMVVLCGIPGSGKSTFARKMIGQLEPHYRKRWEIANQDKLGTRTKVMSAARSALHGGRCIIIDRCNFNVDQRLHWLQLAQEHSVSTVLALTMPGCNDLELCITRAYSRGISDGHAEDVNWNAVCRGMERDFQHPTAQEGFSAVFQCHSQRDLDCFADSIRDIGLREKQKELDEY